MIRIDAPLNPKIISSLKAGYEVLLSGIIYTARDQAHKRLTESLKQNKELPFVILNQVIYYCGPTKTPKGKVIGSCGPTTSRRMDNFTPFLLKAGLRGMIGKGSRSDEVIAAIRKYNAVYFLAPAGCGALIARYVLKVTAVAYKDLGPEKILRLKVKDLPLIVGIDSKGKCIF